MSTVTEQPLVSKSENLYEGIFLLDSAKFASNPDDVAKQVLGILEKAGATIATHRPWLDGKLAYLIEGHRKGLHYLVLFRMPATGMSGIARACKLTECILRHIIVKHPQALFDAMVTALTTPPESSTPETDKKADSPPDKKPDTKADSPPDKPAASGDTEDSPTESTESKSKPS